jgi:hypothetical protein
LSKDRSFSCAMGKFLSPERRSLLQLRGLWPVSAVFTSALKQLDMMRYPCEDAFCLIHSLEQNPYLEPNSRQVNQEITQLL